jgi:thiol-disulfide isomerase/thioredoxin
LSRIAAAAGLLLVCGWWACRTRPSTSRDAPARPAQEKSLVANSVTQAVPAASSPPVQPILFPRTVDVDGVLRHPGQTAPGVTTVFVFLATHCPICNAYLPELNRMSAAYASQNVAFFGVIADRQTSIGVARKYRRSYQLAFPVLLDTTGCYRRALGPTHTPQAIVVDRHGAIVYSGRIDDRYAAIGRPRWELAHRDLEDALWDLGAGHLPKLRQTQPVGCLLEPADAVITSKVLTFCRDIAPIIFANCVRCHREGEAAPFPLATYEDVRSHATQIASVVEQRIMPPWRPRQGFGQFRNELRLSEGEISRIVNWLANGAPQGNPSDLPARPQFATGWQLGTPDLVLMMPEPYDIPADGPDIYRHFVIPTGLTEERLVSGFEFRPGNPRVIHHSFLYFDVRGQARRLDAADPGPGYSRFGGPGFLVEECLGGWAPGGLPRQLPPGMGRPIPAHSDLVLQVHYHPTGKPERDRSTVGFYFAPQSARRVAGEIMVATSEIDIPAGKSQHRQAASYTLPVDTALLDVTPHMHVLGRQIKATAVLPNGAVIPLVAIDDWNFYWQDHYVYREPVPLPAGSRIDVEAFYDNSSENPLNPHHPPHDVHFGEMTDDEMCICYFQVTTDTVADMIALKGDVARYFSELMQRYQRAKAERGGALAAGPRPGAALLGN